MATKKAPPTSKSKPTKGFSFSDFDKQISKIPGFELGSILETNTFSKVDEWIPTGNYLFSAQLSGSLFGGIPNNRSVMIAGDPGAGKSFVCLNVAREAQKMGYNVIYCDTEGAIDFDSAVKFGIDPKRLRYQPIQTVSEFKHFVLTVIDMMKDTGSKTMIIVDSLGMLGTDKEMKDAREGHNAGDMGLKAKELRSLFRSITFALTDAKIPLICTNHVYCLTAGHKILMADDSYKEVQDIKVGEFVKTLDGINEVYSISDFDEQEVVKLTLENGQTIECTPNHKFLINENWKDESSWKQAKDLTETDEILCSD